MLHSIFGFQPMTPAQVAILFGAGISAAVGQFGITAAYRLARPRELAVYDYSNVAFAAVFGFLVFGQVPDAFSWLGIAIIVSMGVWMNRADGRTRPETENGLARRGGFRV